jgi:Restriction endonuclease
MTQKPKKQKPKKQNPEWEKLEIIVKEIQEQLSPEATVRHDHRVIGKSGSERKLDVSISQTISSFPVFIVFDCKHASKDSKLVKLKDVEAFIGQLEDVEATHGVMVSNTGFDAGAKRKARLKNIFLQIFRKANETDWNALFGEIVGIVFAHVTWSPVKTLVILVGNSTVFEIPFNTQIFNAKGESISTMENKFIDAWKRHGRPIDKDKFELTFSGTPLYIKIDNEMLPIQEVGFDIKIIAKKYLVNPKMAEGKILEDDATNKMEYRSLKSEGIDWAEVLNSQSGIEIDNDEYQRIINNGTLIDDLSNRERYIKIVTEEKGS